MPLTIAVKRDSIKATRQTAFNESESPRVLEHSGDFYSPVTFYLRLESHHTK